MKRLPIISVFSGTGKLRDRFHSFWNLDSKQIQHYSLFDQPNFNDRTNPFKEILVPNFDVKTILAKTRFTTLLLCQIFWNNFVFGDRWFHSRESPLLMCLFSKIQISTRKCTFSGWAKSWSIFIFRFFGDGNVLLKKRAKNWLKRLNKGLVTSWVRNPALICNF